MSQTMNQAEFREIAASWGISAQAGPLFDLVGPMQTMMSSIEDLPRPAVAPMAARRELGAAADRENDPYNAVVRWCDIGVPGADGPLSGTRVAVKDCMAVAGLPMTAGSALLEGFVADRDSAVVERVLGAGARVVAMTNMDDMAVSPGGDSSVYGPTLNPYDVTRTAGGSSGGSAAALHYPGVDVALGTDTGGSVRIPASWCGVIGHKPTHGLVSHNGVLGADPHLDHVGVLARSASDVARTMQVLAGRHGDDPRQPGDLPTIDFLGAVEAAPASLDGVRIGWVTEGVDPAVGVAPEVTKEFMRSLSRLEELGALVTQVSVPEHLQSGPIGFVMFSRGFASLMRGGGNAVGVGGAYWPELATALREGLATRADQMSPQLMLSLMLGSTPALADGVEHYAMAANLRRWLRTGYDRALSSCDVLMMPTTPVVAHPVDPDLDVATRVTRSWSLVANTAPTNLTGHPAVSIPLGSSEGRPVGAMLIGRHFEDARVLAITRTIERGLGWA